MTQEEEILKLRENDKDIFERIDRIKDELLENSKKLLDLNDSIKDNKIDDLMSKDETKELIRKSASKSGSKSGIKWASILSALGVIIQQILEGL